MGSSYSYTYTYTIILFTIILLNNIHGKLGAVKGATFTFVNKCSQTIWPAIQGHPTLDTTGFELQKGTLRVFQAPTGWSGRFWARTGCEFDGSGQGSCTTGDCGSGHMECNGAGSTAATLAEFTLGSGSMDFYDASLVDGFNLPMIIDVSGGSGQCASTGCVEDLNQRCPTELRIDGGGACRSACDAFGSPEYCCKASYGSPSTCKASKYSQMFKNACPKCYSYAYDDATSTFTCTAADYVITFCPILPRPPSQISSKSDHGLGPEDGSSGVGSESWSMSEAMLEDGSWLANLATGDSTRLHDSFGATSQILLLIVHLASTVVLLVVQ